jgi:beta-galactosidase
MIAQSALKTAGQHSQVKLTADRISIRAANQDLSYVTVELVDAQGTRHPKADNLVQFAIEGPGSMVAVGNANPKSVESNQDPQRRAWQGRCLVIVKAGEKGGKIRLRASAEGLEPAEVVISARR